MRVGWYGGSTKSLWAHSIWVFSSPVHGGGSLSSNDDPASSTFKLFEHMVEVVDGSRWPGISQRPTTRRTTVSSQLWVSAVYTRARPLCPQRTKWRAQQFTNRLHLCTRFGIKPGDEALDTGWGWIACPVGWFEEL